MATQIEATPIRSIECAPAERINRFIARQLADDDLYLLAILNDGDSRYLLTEGCSVNITGYRLRSVPVTRMSTGRVISSPHLVWGKATALNCPNAVECIKKWERQKEATPLSLSTFTFTYLDKPALVFGVNDGQGQRYIIVQRQYAELLVRTMGDLKHCTVEMLPDRQVRVTWGKRVLGILMPIAHSRHEGGSAFFTADEFSTEEG